MLLLLLLLLLLMLSMGVYCSCRQFSAIGFVRRSNWDK